MRSISIYSSEMDILLVGEGDFSFACALARAFERAPRLLATSLDSRVDLSIKYEDWSVASNLREILLREGRVMLEVDVKSMAQHSRLCNFLFDRIVYNFPHSGHVLGWTECTEALIKQHRRLMRAFFASASRMLREGGEVHVTHHMDGVYAKWRLQKEAAKSKLQLRQCVGFWKGAFPGYTPRQGGLLSANGTFPLQNPATFIFSLPSPPPPPPLPPLPLYHTYERHPLTIMTPGFLNANGTFPFHINPATFISCLLPPPPPPLPLYPPYIRHPSHERHPRDRGNPPTFVGGLPTTLNPTGLERRDAPSPDARSISAIGSTPAGRNAKHGPAKTKIGHGHAKHGPSKTKTGHGHTKHGPNVPHQPGPLIPLLTHPLYPTV